MFNASGTRTELESYLIEITRDIFSVKDGESGEFPRRKILDTAQQKGTGKWMSQHALDLGVPTTLITEAVYLPLPVGPEGGPRLARPSSWPDPAGELRGGTARHLLRTSGKPYTPRKICSYAQGFVQL